MTTAHADQPLDVEELAPLAQRIADAYASNDDGEGIHYLSMDQLARIAVEVLASPPELPLWQDDPVWSDTRHGDRRLSWREACLDARERRYKDRRLAEVLSDLDRCQHGRHEGDDCSGCGGPSHGNPLPALAAVGRGGSGPARLLSTPEPVPRQIGYTLDGSPIVIPSSGLHVAWRWTPDADPAEQGPE